MKRLCKITTLKQGLQGLLRYGCIKIKPRNHRYLCQKRGKKLSQLKHFFAGKLVFFLGCYYLKLHSRGHKLVKVALVRPDFWCVGYCAGELFHFADNESCVVVVFVSKVWCVEIFLGWLLIRL